MMDTLWRTRDGQLVLVSQMSDSHLHHSIAMILRSKKGWRREYLDRLLLEVTIRSLGK
jgi:hypothetical protein